MARKSGFQIVPVKAGNFDFNQVLEVEASQKHGQYLCVAPLGGLTEAGPYTCYFPPIENKWMLMDKTGIEVVAKIVNADGSALDTFDTKVAAVNLLALTMWDSIEILLNGQSFGGTMAMNYNYKAYLQTVLSYGSEARKTWMKSMGFVLDTPKHGDDMAYTGTNSSNEGWKTRYVMAAGSSQMSMYSPLPHDFLKASNHLAPGNRLEVQLNRAKDSFILNSKTSEVSKYKLVITKLLVWVYYVELEKQLPSPTVEVYFITKTEMHRTIIAQGMPEFNMRLIQAGVLPKQVIICMTRSTAAEGEYNRNPFNFLPFNASNIKLYIDGTAFPPRGLQVDFSGGTPLCARAYHWVYEHTGLAGQSSSNCMTLSHFEDGMFVIPFNLNPDICGGFHTHAPRVGTLDVDITFTTPTPFPIAFHYLLCYDKIVLNNREDNTVQLVDCVP